MGACVSQEPECVAVLVTDLRLPAGTALGAPVYRTQEAEKREPLIVPFVSNPSLPQTSRRTSVGEAFRLWSKTYDDELNPLLALEQRFVNSLLPRVDGRNVLDVGCGTGRWLRALSGGKPAALVG